MVKSDPGDFPKPGSSKVCRLFHPSSCEDLTPELVFGNIRLAKFDL
jgi:hypothetical protein